MLGRGMQGTYRWLVVLHSLSNSSVLPVRVTWDVGGANIHVRLMVDSCAFSWGILGFIWSLLFHGPCAPCFFLLGSEERSFQGSSAPRIMSLVARVTEWACMFQACQYIGFFIFLVTSMYGQAKEFASKALI